MSYRWASSRRSVARLLLAGEVLRGCNAQVGVVKEPLVSRVINSLAFPGALSRLGPADIGPRATGTQTDIVEPQITTIHPDNTHRIYDSGHSSRSTEWAVVTHTSRPKGRLVCVKETGGVLLSQALASQVPSALRGLTSLFGMGRGVSLSLRPPEKRERPRVSGSFKTTQRHSGYHYPRRGNQKNPSSPRAISTGLLQTLPSFQIRPINLVVYQGPYSL